MQTITNRNRFLNACHCQAVDRPPVWLMRQAGRALPEYRALKEKHSFLELVQTPELAVEVTLQPIRRFGFDAAILFSDILVIPEALGQAYRFRETGGIQMDFAIASGHDIARLKWEGLTDRLQYVAHALRLLRNELGKNTALLGFAGSPWTLANFMAEGGSAPTFTRALQWLAEDERTFAGFLDNLSAALIAYLQMQIEAGVDAIQIFDSLGGLLDDAAFANASAQWIEKIVIALGGRVPIIVFSKGRRRSLDDLIATRAQVLSFDHSVQLDAIRSQLPQHIAIQGNLDPSVLCATPEVVAAETDKILKQMQGRNGYIFNLGHGLPADAKVENVASLVETVRSFAWQS